MKKLNIQNSESPVECLTGSPVGQGLLAGGLEIPMLCGGRGVCATCHVFVVEGMANLSPIEAREEKGLNLLPGRAPNSRLSCQARLLGDVKVRLPDASYTSNLDELEAMVGTRASRDILHGIDGRLLVRKGQLVTRYIVNQLRKEQA